jgi:hypothetical protein
MIVVISLVISLPLWASAEEVGNFTQVLPRVDYQKGETGPLTPAQVRAPVEVKDIINTYELSRAQIQFRDQSVITIAPKSKVTIENYMFDPSRFERNVTIGLTEGVMKVVTSLESKGSFIIKATTATLRVRGTEFTAVSGRNFTVVYVLKDRVFIKAVDLTTGKYLVRRGFLGEPGEEEEVCLPPGTMSVILPNQPPSTPRPVSAAIMALAVGLVTTGIRDIPGTCVVGSLPGVHLNAVANDLMSRGANLNDVRASLTDVCYPAAESYTYSPPPPPVGRTFPGGGQNVGVVSPFR